MDNLKRQWSKMEITSFALKWIGIVSMIVDHIGRMFFPDIWVFTAIGRMAFPIFAFLTAVGFMYTANIFRYGIRLFFWLFCRNPFLIMHSLALSFIRTGRMCFYSDACSVDALFMDQCEQSGSEMDRGYSDYAYFRNSCNRL